MFGLELNRRQSVAFGILIAIIVALVSALLLGVNKTSDCIISVIVPSTPAGNTLPVPSIPRSNTSYIIFAVILTVLTSIVWILAIKQGLLTKDLFKDELEAERKGILEPTTLRKRVRFLVTAMLWSMYILATGLSVLAWYYVAFV